METLGEGGAAVVKKCKHKLLNTEYACKIMRNYDIEKEMSSKSEFDLMNNLQDHPNIIKAHEFLAT